MKTTALLCALALAFPLAANAASDFEAVIADESMHEEEAAAFDEGGGGVARAMFTTGIDQREPTNAIEELTSDHSTVYYFSELSNLEGQRVMHRWERDGEILAEVPFEVGGPRWRVYSSKKLVHGWIGKWTVSIVDAGGQVLSRQSFDYVEADGEPDSELVPAAIED